MQSIGHYQGYVHHQQVATKGALDGVCHCLGRAATYAHRFAPRKYPCRNSLHIWCSRCIRKNDYRGIVALLADKPILLDAIDLKIVPRFTTLLKPAPDCWSRTRCTSNRAVRWHSRCPSAWSGTLLSTPPGWRHTTPTDTFSGEHPRVRMHRRLRVEMEKTYKTSLLSQIRQADDSYLLRDTHDPGCQCVCTADAGCG